jgi:hypothetical protein
MRKAQTVKSLAYIDTPKQVPFSSVVYIHTIRCLTPELTGREASNQASKLTNDKGAYSAPVQ